MFKTCVEHVFTCCYKEHWNYATALIHLTLSQKCKAAISHVANKNSNVIEKLMKSILRELEIFEAIGEIRKI